MKFAMARTDSACSVGNSSMPVLWAVKEFVTNTRWTNVTPSRNTNEIRIAILMYRIYRILQHVRGLCSLTGFSLILNEILKTGYPVMFINNT